MNTQQLVSPCILVYCTIFSAVSSFMVRSVKISLTSSSTFLNIAYVLGDLVTWCSNSFILLSMHPWRRCWPMDQKARWEPREAAERAPAQQSGGGISLQSAIRSGGPARGGRGGGGGSHSHVNNYRRVSNYKPPRSANTYSSRVVCARDSFLRAALDALASESRSTVLVCTYPGIVQWTRRQ